MAAADSLLSGLSTTNFVPLESLDSLRDELGAAGYTVLDLDGTDVHDATTFFDAATAQLFGGDRVSNWDSFADVLTNILGGVDKEKIALIWTHAHQMLGGHLRDLIAAADVLTGMSREEYAESRTFVSFLAGDGPNFQRR
jgi:hypothetical protein